MLSGKLYSVKYHGVVKWITRESPLTRSVFLLCIGNREVWFYVCMFNWLQVRIRQELVCQKFPARLFHMLYIGMLPQYPPFTPRLPHTVCSLQFLIKILSTFFISHTCCMSHPVFFFVIITRTMFGEEFKSKCPRYVVSIPILYVLLRREN